MPDTGSRAVKAVGHGVARRLGGVVEQIAAPGPCSTFSAATLSWPGEPRRFVILCHRHVPVIALAEAGAAGSPVSVLAHPVIEATLAEQAPFRVLTAAEFGLPPDRADLSRLTRAERRQIAAWKPERLGDLLFNDWD